MKVYSDAEVAITKKKTIPRISVLNVPVEVANMYSEVCLLCGATKVDVLTYGLMLIYRKMGRKPPHTPNKARVLATVKARAKLMFETSGGAE